MHGATRWDGPKAVLSPSWTAVLVMGAAVVVAPLAIALAVSYPAVTTGVVVGLLAHSLGRRVGRVVRALHRREQSRAHLPRTVRR